MLLVIAIQGLAHFPISWYQMVKVIELGMQRELIIFGIANLLGSAAVLLSLQILRWVERPVFAPHTHQGVEGGDSVTAETRMQPLPQSLLASGQTG